MKIETDHVIPVLTAIISAAATFFVTKATTKKDIILANRERLYKDEQQFRQELREELRLAKEKLEALTEEVIQLRETNFRLELENKQLRQEVQELREEIRRLRGEGQIV